MADDRNINRIGSPMDLLDESVVEDPDKVLSGKNFLQRKQQAKSPFLIGSIEEVGRRISQLDQRLQTYRQLVCESRASNDDDAVVLSNHARVQDQFNQRERDKKERNQFGGVYSEKSNLLPNISPQTKIFSKISSNGKQQQQQQQSAAGSKDDPGKPKLVELHLYPGYEPQEATPLPGGIDPCDIFSKVMHASVHLNRKDTFWHLFLDKFQPNKECQQKLFDRTANNYASLLMGSSDLVVKDLFLKSYPRLMSQAVYSTFCFSFPDSYRQFGEHFKDDLVYLVYGWMTGIRPPPRSWITWPTPSLEPANLKQREDMINRKTSKTGRPLTDFDYLDSQPSSHASPNDPTTSRSSSQSTTKSSTAALVGVQGPGPRTGASKVTGQTQADAKLAKDVSLSSVSRGLGLSPSKDPHIPASAKDSSIIRRVSEAQDNPAPRVFVKNGGGATQASPSPVAVAELAHKFSAHARQTRETKESHPAGRGCDFVHTVFNLGGKSPLVEHFLAMRDLQRKAGLLLWVHRVQLENLPSMEAPTYRDVIADSTKNIRSMKRAFLERHKENFRAGRVSIQAQKEILREHIHKQTSLLSNQREVKRLSDLIIMEQRRSSDSVMAGADAAIAAALMAQD